MEVCDFKSSCSKTLIYGLLYVYMVLFLSLKDMITMNRHMEQSCTEIIAKINKQEIGTTLRASKLKSCHF